MTQSRKAREETTGTPGGGANFDASDGTPPREGARVTLCAGKTELAGFNTSSDVPPSASRRADVALAITQLPTVISSVPRGSATTPDLGPPESAMSPLQWRHAGEERYEVTGELGRGGMGRVDAVLDRALGRVVACKKSAGESEHGPLLVVEAQIGAQLEHPSIVPVYDIGLDLAGNPFYTMRVVRGRTLRDVLDDNREPRKPYTGFTQLLGIMRQVCLAVDYAHNRGVIHRDLKPENIIVGAFGEVYVLDWGVAYLMEDGEVRRSIQGVQELGIAGSPGYMAPEQVLGESIDPRTDVFALGVILYEIVSGKRPFYDSDWRNIQQRMETNRIIAPSKCETSRAVSSAFDELVLSCLARQRDDRPHSACVLADAIDAFLDAERARAECEREAEQHAQEGSEARATLERLDAQARRLSAEAETILATIRPWEGIERKQEAWSLVEQARHSAAGAARALARAEAAFTRALGRIPDHRGARAGLAALYFRQFEAAEAQGDQEKMAQYLDLARTYDDGALALELADQGTLSVQSVPRGAHFTIQRYQPRGPLLVLARARALGTMPPDAVLLDSGSYLAIARYGDREVRYPFVVRRAKALSLKIRIPGRNEIPPELIYIPGGPFLRIPPRGTQLCLDRLPDFAIGRFPVTLREYSVFLDSIEDPSEREFRTPATHDGLRQPFLIKEDGVWRISAIHVEGQGRERVPPERELDLPVSAITWFDAVAYTRWLSHKTGLAYRLPTDAEWDKAMRGADGRAYPMGSQLDPAFAKLRESRPEPSQPEPVGVFPYDESPYGVRDLAGGIGDWTTTSSDGSSLPDAADEELPSARGRQAIWRGGTWSSTWAARGWMRYSQEITARAPWVGFRLALSLDARDSSELIVSPMKAPV